MSELDWRTRPFLDQDKIESYVYVARQPKGHYIKIGRTQNLKRRLNGLGLDLIAALHPWDGDVAAFERCIHNDLHAYRAPFGREWFSPTPEVVAYLEDVGGFTLRTEETAT